MVELDPKDLATAQAITAKDRSNLYLSAQFLQDSQRYQAFVAMYAVMRVIDDAIDDVVDKEQLDQAQRQKLHGMLHRWQQRIAAAYAGTPEDQALDRALAWAVQLFPIPQQHWINFVDAMHFDIDHGRFANFDLFLEYAEGATVAPTVIYVYLLTAAPGDDGAYRVDAFDYESCGRDLGIFAYLAHILRDVREDTLVGTHGLVYLSEADLEAADLTASTLRVFAERARGDARFLQVVKTIVERAKVYERRGRRLVEQVAPTLALDRRFVLRLIVSYYSILLQRVGDPQNDLFAGQELLPGTEKVQMILSLASELGFELRPELMQRLL